MLDVRRLRLLYELSRRGTIAAVGEALHTSPSGVSQQLAQLEAEAGLRLTERVGRTVRLTNAGDVLVEHAGVVLDRLERAESELAAIDEQPRGRVRIASFQSATLTLIPPALDALAAHPDLRVELAQAEPQQSLPALFAHDFDLVLGEEFPGAPAPVPAQAHREDLCRDPVRLATREPAQLMEAAHFPWVLEPRGSVARDWAMAMCRSAGFEPTVRYETEDLVAHLALVRHGHAAAFLPDLSWRGADPRVSLCPLPDSERVIFTVVRAGSEHHPATRAVRAALHTAVGAEHASGWSAVANVPWGSTAFAPSSRGTHRRARRDARGG